MQGKAHSPFSPAMIWEKPNRALLLQFLASEIFALRKGLTENHCLEALDVTSLRHFPYDWARPISPMNRLFDHSLFLKELFPEIPRAIARFERTFHKLSTSKSKDEVTTYLKLQELFQAMEPLFKRCKSDENLIFFLLKHRADIGPLLAPESLKSLLHRLFPKNFKQLEEKLCASYHQRGFISLIPELKNLLAELDCVF